MPGDDGQRATPDATPPRRRRVALLWLVLGAAVLLVLALRWASRPEQVARLVLDQAGAALGLQVTSSGTSEYRLRGGPVLVVHDLDARQPGATTPLLRAERAYLALPWSTVRSRGADLIVTRIELDALQLDLPALQRWQATRPPSGPVRIPTLTRGLDIRHGRLTADGWRLEDLAIALPSLHPDRPVRGTAAGRLEAGTTHVPFDLAIALTRPAPDAGLGAAGTVTVRTPGWQLPMQARLSTRLRLDDGVIGLDRLRYGARARYVADGRATPFTLGLAGALRLHEGRLAIDPLGLAIHGNGIVPTLAAHGRLAWHDTLSLRLDGRLPQWPADWPALPAPIGRSRSPLPFALDYDGATDLSGPAALTLRRDATRFDARFRLPAVLDWIRTASQGSPLPPMDGRLSTPRLEIAGAQLEGVTVEFSDDAPIDGAPAPGRSP